MQTTINIPTTIPVTVDLPLYFRKDYHIYAVIDHNLVVCASWYDSLNEGQITTASNAASVLRDYTPESRVQPEEFERQAELAMKYLKSSIQAALPVTA